MIWLAKTIVQIEKGRWLLSTLHYYIQIARPQHVLMGVLTTWIATLLSGSNSVIQFYVSLVIGLDIIGASLFYFATANTMYIRKNRRYSFNKLPLLIIGGIGFFAMLSAIVVAIAWLKVACVWLVVFNTLVILFYAQVFSKHWLSKNLLMALVCTTPIVLGWRAGESTHDIMPSVMVTVFFAYLTRELIKDIQDKDIDRFCRKTMPLSIGIHRSRYVAGIFMFLAILSLALLIRTIIVLGEWIALVPMILTVVFFFLVQYSLVVRNTGHEAQESKRILLGNAGIILSGLLLVI